MDPQEWLSVVEDIKMANWRQGDILPPELTIRVIAYAREKLSYSELRNIPQQPLCIIASHTCDCQNQSKHRDVEPFIEVGIGCITGKVQENAQKMTRLVDLVVSDGSERKNLKVEDKNRIRVPREWLRGHKPSKEVFLEREERRRFARFLAKRFDRPAFPDMFEEGLRPALSKDAGEGCIKHLMKKNGKLLSGMYFRLRPEEELQSGEKYKLAIIGTMRSRQSVNGEGKELDSGYFFDDQHARDAAEDLLRSVAKSIRANCPRIDIVREVDGDLNYNLSSEREVTIAELRELRSYDWEYLSPDEDSLPIAAPE